MIYVSVRVSLAAALMGSAAFATPDAVRGAEASGSEPPRPVLRLSLREAMEVALDKNPQVRLFSERIQSARSAARTQLGALLPNLVSTAKYNNQTFFLGTIGGAPVRTSPFDIVDARGSLSQSLFSMSLIDRWRASRAALQVAELESAATNNDAMAAVALHYLEILRHREFVESRKANVELYEELIRHARSRQTGGVATGLDAVRLETQLEHERQRLELSRSDVERATLGLINALGISFDLTLVLTDEMTRVDEFLPSQDLAIRNAMGSRPELQAQLQRMRVAGLSLSSIQGERIPSLSAQGDYGLIGNRSDNTLGTYNIGVVLQIPIFDGGQREGRISESRSQLEQEHIKLRLVTNQVTMETREALATLASAREQYRIANGGLKTAATEVQLARERFRALSANTLELSNALSSLVRAKDNFVDALFRVNASRVNLARAQGRMDQLDLPAAK